MKQQPITFREEYENVEQEDVLPYFERIQLDENHVVTRRIVEIEPAKWNEGVMLVVRILDVVSFRELNQNGILEMGTRTVEVHKRWIYDHYQNPTETSIQPTHEQVDMMWALLDGELRGKTAERIVRNLYVSLVVLEPKFELEKWLPLYVQWWKEYFSH